MNRFYSCILAGLFVLFTTGCATQAPPYAVSIPNVEALKSVGNFKASVGAFSSTAGQGNANPISLRGNSMVSPYDNSYAAYVAAAIKDELTMAQKFAPGADLELSGILIKNDIDAAIGTGRSNIEVRMIVKKGGKVRYDQVKQANHEWESSFAGMVAIPKAKQEYPTLIQKLLAALYADPAFVAAIQ